MCISWFSLFYIKITCSAKGFNTTLVLFAKDVDEKNVKKGGANILTFKLIFEPFFTGVVTIDTIHTVYRKRLLVALSVALVCLMSLNSFGQKEGQALVDSLEHELKTVKEDTNKVKILNTISYNFFFINPDSGIIYGRVAHDLSEQLHWQKGIGDAYKNIGNSYMSKSSYDTALSYYGKAKEMFETINDQNSVARVLGNMGSMYEDLGDYPKSLEHQFTALRIYEKTGDLTGRARIYGNIGNLYQDLEKYSEALRYDTMALNIHRGFNEKRPIAIDMGNIGNVYANMNDHVKALDFDFKSLAVYEELRDSSSIANKLQKIADAYSKMDDFTKALGYSFKSLKIYESVSDKDGMARVLGNIGSKYFEIAKNMKGNSSQLPAEAVRNLQSAIDYTTKAIAIFEEIEGMNALFYAYGELANEYDLAGNYKEAMRAHRKYADLKDSVLKNAKNVRFANLEKEHAIDQMRNAEKEKQAQVRLNALLKAKKRNESILFTLGMIILLGGIVLVLRQRKMTEDLLLNILPPKIAERLKAKEHPIADHFGDASIIFIDIAGFTKLSERSDPKSLVNILNDVFTRFDAIAGKHGLEKIKTIGDCYMAVAGIPEKDANHPLKVADMALDVRDAMKDYKTHEGTPIHFRIGIDCGTVVAGVIGKKKFIYDIWGDSVNTASRMESSGIPGEIHCTDNFKKRLPANYTFTSRGEVNIKGKGPMHTWILVSSVKHIVS